MTYQPIHTFSSHSAFANLLNRVVLLLLGTPPTVQPVRVAAAVNTADSRIMPLPLLRSNPLSPKP
jgi:hypothetical protein